MQGIERRERIVAGSLVGAIGLIHRFGIVEQHLGIAVGHPVMLHLGALRQVEVVGQELFKVISRLACIRGGHVVPTAR